MYSRRANDVCPSLAAAAADAAYSAVSIQLLQQLTVLVKRAAEAGSNATHRVVSTIRDASQPSCINFTTCTRIICMVLNQWL